MTDNNKEIDNHFDKNQSDYSLQENKKNIFIKILEWCKRTFLRPTCYLLIIIFVFNIVNYFLDHNKYFSIEKTAKLKQARIEANSSLMCGDKVLITGGYKNFLFESPLKTTEIYDLKKNKVTKGPDMNFAHTKYEQFILPSCEVLIADSEGQIESYNPKTNNFEIWNVKPEIFKNGGQKPTYTLLKDGNILISGGEHSYNGENYSYYTFPFAEILNTKTRTITKINDLPFPLAEHMFFYDKDGNVIIFGGKKTDFYKNRKRIIREVKNHKVIEKTVDEKNVREISGNIHLIKFNNKNKTFNIIGNNSELTYIRAVSMYIIGDEILFVGGYHNYPNYDERIDLYNIKTNTTKSIWRMLSDKKLPHKTRRIFENNKLLFFEFKFVFPTRILIFDINKNKKVWTNDENFNAFEKRILLKHINNIQSIKNKEYLLFSKKKVYRIKMK